MIWPPSNYHGLTLIPAWIDNYMPSKVWVMPYPIQLYSIKSFYWQIQYLTTIQKLAEYIFRRPLFLKFWGFYLSQFAHIVQSKPVKFRFSVGFLTLLHIERDERNWMQFAFSKFVIHWFTMKICQASWLAFNLFVMKNSSRGLSNDNMNIWMWF